MAKKSSVSAILESQATKTAKKSSIPDLSGAEKQADKIFKLKVAAQDAEAAFRVAEQELIQIVQVEYEERGSSGDFVKSLNVTGSQTPGVQVTYCDKFSSIDYEHKAALQKADPEFSKHFEERRDISLKVTDDEVIEKLIAKLGEKLFAELFEVKLSIVAKEGTDRAQFSLGDEVRSFLKQQKPSVKLNKE